MSKRKIQVTGLVGDLNWRTARNTLVSELMQCESEKDFMRVLTMLLASIGTEKDLTAARKQIGIHPFTRDDNEVFKRP